MKLFFEVDVREPKRQLGARRREEAAGARTGRGAWWGAALAEEDGEGGDEEEVRGARAGARATGPAGGSDDPELPPATDGCEPPYVKPIDL